MAREGGCSAGLGGGIFSRITTLFGTAVEAARSSEGIFVSILLLSLFYVGECPVDAQILRKCVGSIMKLDQKSKVIRDGSSSSLFFAKSEERPVSPALAAA